MPTPRWAVYRAIDTERDYQEAKWNPTTTPTEGKHSVNGFLVFLQDYLTEAFHQTSRQADPKATQDALNTIRKLAGLCVACMEQHGAPQRPNNA